MLAAVIALSAALPGCSTTRTTDTPRSGVEQLLVSNAIDHSLDKVAFDALSGQAVYVDEKYLECVDKKYVIGSLRQRAFRAGARLVDKPEEADIVLEVHSGSVGTDRSEGFIGVPALSMPGPLPIQLPEIKFFSQSSQYGTAKIGVVAYDAKTKESLSAGGLARARSSNNNWSILGIGPFNSGTIPEEVALAKRRGDRDPQLRLSDRRALGADRGNSPDEPFNARAAMDFESYDDQFPNEESSPRAEIGRVPSFDASR